MAEASGLLAGPDRAQGGHQPEPTGPKAGPGREHGNGGVRWRSSSIGGGRGEGSGRGRERETQLTLKHEQWSERRGAAGIAGKTAGGDAAEAGRSRTIPSVPATPARIRR